MIASEQEIKEMGLRRLREQAALDGESDGPTMAYPPKPKPVTALALYKLPNDLNHLEGDE
jgi:hypothetical protein